MMADRPEYPDVPNILDALEKKKRRATAAPAAPKSEAPMVVPSAATQFRALGYDRDRFFFFTASGLQIRELSAQKLIKKAELFTLASMEWWEREFSDDAGFTGRAVDQAANYLIQSCYKQGVFSPDLRRGRGVWRDGEQVVIHAGDCLYIDGCQVALIAAQTTAVYEQQSAIAISMDDPLSADEAQQVLTFCKSLNWSETAAELFAGWLVIAIASGALPWRPHVLLNGPKGCGKSWIIQVATRLLGGFVLAVTGATSAAGLRQELASDALPVIFDEAEGDSQRAASNIDDVLALARHSSSSFDAKVIKGGADGKSTGTTVRSCFCLAAIRDPLTQAADQSRFSVLEVRPSTAAAAQKWKKTSVPLADAICDPAFSRRFRGRVFARLPDLLATVLVCSEVAGQVFGDQRMGDQIGALVAGAWLLTHDGIPTAAQAETEIRALDLHEDMDRAAESSDEQACLSAILEAHIKVDGTAWHGDASVGELVRFVVDVNAWNASKGTPLAPGEEDKGQPTLTGGVSLKDAERTLGMYGLRVADGGLLISNTNEMLKRKIMAHTTWSRGWSKVLERLPGATKPPTVVKIGGHVSRCVKVPVNDS
jgi:putative DNA primase/helicase